MRRLSWLLTASLLLLTGLSVAGNAPAGTANALPPGGLHLADAAGYVARQFGPSFKLDPKSLPLAADLDGDGHEDLILVGTSATPLRDQKEYGFRVEDPYDAYYGTGNPEITSQFSLHFDGSSRCLMIVFDWRSDGKRKSATKFVIINLPFESLSVVNLRLKKKQLQAIEALDRTTLRSLVFWDGRRWLWRAQGMEGDESLFAPPPAN